MVLGCDIVIAVDAATFGLPEARVGRLPLDGGMTLLQRQVPFRQAMGMLLTGRRIAAAEAYRMGLVGAPHRSSHCGGSAGPAPAGPRRGARIRGFAGGRAGLQGEAKAGLEGTLTRCERHR